MAISTAEPSTGEAEGEAGLKANAIGFVDALVIGLASTAPAYSLAAVIGSLVVVVGAQAPGALLASFVPMFFIATAFYYMNRADPDAGLGSVPHKLLQVSETPVLVVPYPAEKEPVQRGG